MKFNCNFCNSSFSQNTSLKKHLGEKRCKSILINDNIKINELVNDKQKIFDKEILNKNIIIQEQIKEIEKLRREIAINIEGNNNLINSTVNNNINMKIEININPITKLDIKHIETDKLKEIIEKLDSEKTLVCGIDNFNNDKMNLFLSGYIKDMICNTEHPENHSVKYVKRNPPTYNTHIEDQSGNTVSVIKGLKDTCELLTDPILDQLKIKLREFIMKYKGDTEPEFDFGLYENVILELRRELNKQNVKKALKTVLKNDILNNIEMKLTLLEMK